MRIFKRLALLLLIIIVALVPILSSQALRDKLLAYEWGRVYADDFTEAEKIKLLLEDEQYAQADQLLSAMAHAPYLNEFGTNPFTVTIYFLTRQEPLNQDFLDTLQRWMHAHETSAIPYIIRAECYIALARKYIDDKGTVAIAQAPKQYHDYVAQAARDVQAAWQRDAAIPYIAEKQLMLARLANESDARKEQLFQEGIATYPNHYELHLERMLQLELKWGGSTERMREFADRYASADTLFPLYKNLTLLMPYDFHYRALFNLCKTPGICDPWDISRAQGKYLTAPEVKQAAVRSLAVTARRFPRIAEVVANHAAGFMGGGFMEPGYDVLAILKEAVGEGYYSHLIEGRNDIRFQAYERGIAHLLQAEKDVAISPIRSQDAKNRLISRINFSLAKAYIQLISIVEPSKLPAAVTFYGPYADRFLTKAIDTYPYPSSRAYYRLRAQLNLMRNNIAAARDDLLKSLSKKERTAFPADMDAQSLERYIKTPPARNIIEDL